MDETTAEPSGAAPVLVSAHGLGKRFSGFVALDALDFELRAGEVVGLLGPNGAGKTTTLKLLLGLLRPSTGHAQVLGFDCTHEALRVKERVGFTPDEPQFYDFLTGRETLDFTISARGLSPEPAWAGLREKVTVFDFEAQLGALTSSYSHGMKKKLAMLCALVHRPRVLLLDEPTNGLDPPTALRVRELLRREADAGATVLVSTHLLDMAERMCDRLIVMDHGRVIGAGTAAHLRALAGVADDASLEDAFLALVGT
ncbi:MAG TPA: ABC transporter ATP-binding protein [Polyangiales bacterium]|nr:ABC transporter ATP-binding protein [Polyangiales bacterium]